MKCIKVLLIEDNLGDAVLIQEMLKDVKTTNFQVKHAQILSEGIEYLQNEDFDIILLDLALPDSQGIDTFNRANEHAAELPIIILTGLSDEEFAIKAVGEGAQDYLVKGEVDSRLLARSMKYAIERNIIEDKLKKSEERYRIMVEKTQSGIFLINPYNKLNYVNQQMADMLGYKVNEMINRSIFDFMDKEGEKALNDHLKKIDNGIGNIYELKFKNRSGSQLWALTSTNPIYKGNGEYLGSVSIITDISARKGVEKTIMEAMIEKDNNFRMIIANMMEAIKPLIAQEYSEEYHDRLT
ncbi:MAG: PAS domain S-box protein [Methanobacteriaceae archaeon]|jgi:PAS domain S-box-containing protein|nr:PAS domain S-box protein [Methanobacteriaceae archaeon]OPY23488.1 MAG: DNA-binding transcriptional regulator BasR [Methanobacterium sp. PtaU1.Bin097]